MKYRHAQSSQQNLSCKSRKRILSQKLFLGRWRQAALDGGATPPPEDLIETCDYRGDVGKVEVVKDASEMCVKISSPGGTHFDQGDAGAAGLSRST